MPGPREVRNQAPCLRRPCDSCRQPFRPHPRLKARQRTCGREACKKAHRAAFRREYRKQNPKAEQDIGAKAPGCAPAGLLERLSAESHPVATARNRANSRLRKMLSKAGLQRQLDIVQLIDPPEKLEVVVGFW